MASAKVKSTLKVQDNLNLLAINPPIIPPEITFPDELNKYFQEELKRLIHENGMLKKNISEQEQINNDSKSQINLLNNQLQKYTSHSTFTSASDVASVKIVELTKKLREKYAEVEVLKTKCSKLEIRVMELQNTKINEEEIDLTPVREEKSEDQLGREIKKLQDKLNCTTSKLFEVRNSNTQLKSELQKANNLVQQEIGEPLEKIQSTGWRGRAQTICDLQQKVMELKEKLKSYQDKSFQNEIVHIQQKASKQIETLMKENNCLKENLQETKKKLETFKSRCKVLDLDNGNLRIRMSNLTESNEKDRELIKQLTGQLCNTQQTQNDVIKQNNNKYMKLEKENQRLNIELTREVLKVENLENKLKALKNDTQYSVAGIQSKSQFSDEKHLAFYEAERVRLLELVNLSNRKLDEERETHAATQIQLRTEKQKTAKLESRLARAHLDYNHDRNSSYSLISSKSSKEENILQNKLELAEETIKALETRLQTEKNERKLDFMEFSKILENYPVSQSNSMLSLNNEN